MRFLSVLLLTLTAAGCAPLEYKARFRTMGAFDLDRESKVHRDYLRLRQQNQQDRSRVEVLVDAIPQGLKVRDGVISNDKGFQHQLLGKFELGPDSGTFPKYRATWRKGLCYPQIPLAWLTGYMWTVLSPTFYPCFPRRTTSKEEIVSSVRQLAEAAGGDLAVLSFIGERGENREQAQGAVGFILRLDRRVKQDPGEKVPLPRAGTQINI